MDNKLWAFLALLAGCWGASFMAYEIALDSLPVSTVVMYRVAGGAALMWVVALVMGWQIPRGRIWFDYFIMGLLGVALPFFLIAWGQQYIESGLASIFNAATAVFGTLLAPLFIAEEKFGKAKIAGVVLGFFGVTMSIGWTFIATMTFDHIGAVAGIGASISYAISGIYVKMRASGNGKSDTLGMLTTAGILLIIMHFYSNPDGNLIPSTNGILACIYLASVSTVLAYLLFFAIIKSGGASFVMLVTLLVPPISIGLGAVFLGERLGLNAYIGFGMLALALIIIDGRVFKRR